jgi:thioredoxin 1
MKKSWLSLICIIFAGFCAGYISPSQAAEPKVDLQALLAKKVPILLEFGSNCCSPCNYSKKTLDKLAAAYQGRAVVTGVDVTVNKNMARDFRIRLTPTQVFLTPDGKEFFRKEGNLRQDQIIQVFSKMGLQPPNVQNRGPVASPQSALRPNAATRQ